MTSILDAYPEYRTTAVLDGLRATEYSYLDEQNHLYLDYTGSGLAARSQHRAHAERLGQTLLGNPHSVNPTSEAATALVEQARARVLAHVGASPDEYAVVFTANATAAARLVGEAYPFRRRARLVLTFDNHNSVNGIREFARRKHARTVYVPARAPELRVETAALAATLGPRRKRPKMDEEKWISKEMPSEKGMNVRMNMSMGMRMGMALSSLGLFSCMTLPSAAPRANRKGLFAYPAQSNFSGVRHPLSWIPLAQERGYDVLLDAAAYLPTGTLDLSTVRPEFVIVSWYKLFGYPTGVGCLIARRDALARLERPWFSGGTIQAVSVSMPWHIMAPDQGAFEDGTLNFLSIPDVQVGLDWLAGIGMPVIETRVRCLTGWFLDRLARLEHSDGAPMIKLYGPTDTKMRGGTVCFNFIDAEGKVVDERLVAMESAAARISLRTGCFCNPGGGEDAFGLDVTALRPLLWAKTPSLDEYVRLIGLPSAGAIRVSFGLASTAEDVDRFIAFAKKMYMDRVTTSDGLPPRERC